MFDIKQQCAGLIYGLSLADHFIRAGTCRHVLVACSEVLSTRIDGSYDGRNIAILLGDGAGAVVVGPSPDGRRGILSTILHADGRLRQGPLHGGPGSGLGRKEHVTADDIEAGRVHFRMDGKAVFQNGVEKMSDAILRVPARQRPDAGRHPRAGAASGQPPHAGGDRRPTWASRGKKST